MRTARAIFWLSNRVRETNLEKGKELSTCASRKCGCRVTDDIRVLAAAIYRLEVEPNSNTSGVSVSICVRDLRQTGGV